MLDKRHLVLFVILCIMLTGVFSWTGYAEEETLPAQSAKVIRVGFPIQGGLTQKDEYGNYSGYTYEYLQEIAQYTGWEYKFIESSGDINESLIKMLDMLSKGEIDILGAMVKNEDTEKLFDFAEYGYGFNYTTLGALEENSRINEDNFQAVKGLRIAIYKDADYTKQRLQDFCKANNIEYKLVNCKSDDDMVKALKKNEADVMVGSDLTPVKGIRTIAQFNGAQFYFAVPKGQAQTVNELNRAILTIQQVKPHFDSDLYEKYFSNQSDKLNLSLTEQEYIKSAEPLKIAMIKSQEPIQYAGKGGEMKGIMKSILDRIADDIGLEFEYVSVDTTAEALQYMKENKADAVSGIPYDYDLAQKNKLIMTSPLVTAQMTMIARADHKELSSGQRVGVIGNDQKQLSDDKLQILGYDSVDDCMKAVQNGKIDFAYMNLYSAEFLSHQEQYKSLQLIPQTDKSVNFSIGIKKPVETELVSILNKAVNSISDTDLEAIVYSNISDSAREVTPEAFVKENPFLVVGVISVVFLILAVVGIVMYRFRIKTFRRLDIEHRRYLQLSNLANEYIYEYDCLKDVVSFSEGFSEVFSFPRQINNFLILLKEDKNNAFNAEMFDILKDIFLNSQSSNAEYWCVQPNGEQRWYRNTVAEIKDQDNMRIYVIGKLTDVQEEKEEREALERRVLLDGLTGIYNRSTVEHLIDQRLQSVDQTGYYALALLDIDHFKAVNDCNGHDFGDKMLVGVSQTVKCNLPEDALFGRLGGDEFIIYIDQQKTDKDVAALMKTLVTQVQQQYEKSKHPVTVSIGAWCSKYSGNTFSKLYKAADVALYQVKEQGRNDVKVVVE